MFCLSYFIFLFFVFVWMLMIVFCTFLISVNEEEFIAIMTGDT